MDDYGDLEGFEVALLAFSEALKKNGFIPSWKFFLQYASALANVYEDAPATSPPGGYVQAIAALRIPMMVTLYGPDWKKILNPTVKKKAPSSWVILSTIRFVTQV